MENVMSHLTHAPLKLLQVVIVFGALAGCSATEAENKSQMMGNGQMDMGNMMCTPDMMKNMSSDQMKMMKSMSPDQRKMMKNMSSDQVQMIHNCMGSNRGMMSGQNRGSASAKSKPTQTDNGSHTQHHPVEGN
jgi:hypothetical protein